MLTPPDPPEVRWLAHAAVPVFGWDAWSKNRTWRKNRAGSARLFRLTRGAEANRDELALRLRPQLAGAPDGRLWVAVRVRFREARGDGANAVDLVLDAVQQATGRDDRTSGLWRAWGEVHRDLQPCVDVWVGVEAGYIEPPPPRRKPARRRAAPGPPAAPGPRAPWLPAP